MSVIGIHREYLPGFGIVQDQRPVCIYTVLSLGMSGRDCAAYRGVGPNLSMADVESTADMMERIKSGGTKISETEARELFDLSHEGRDLTYRR